MNREILFRGKRTDNGEWVEGNLIRYISGQSAILEIGGLRIFSVIPATVGQYTGITDKNGSKIFEGDIIFNTYSCGQNPSKVIWDRGGFVRYSQEGYYYIMPDSDNNMFEIIGNIHENPELLEVDCAG